MKLATRGAEGRTGQADDPPGPDLHRVPGLSEYGIVSRYFVYKRALLEEAERLVQAHVLREQEEIFYLTLQELQRRRTNQVDEQLICQHKDAFRS